MSANRTAPNGLRVCVTCGGVGPRSCICDLLPKIEIRTEDAAWISRHEAGRDGRYVATAKTVERVTFGGQAMVRFHLADLPTDFSNATVMVPAEWLVRD